MVRKEKNIAISLLCRSPNIIWLNFLNNFYQYDIFIFIDDNTKDYANLFNIKNSKLTIIQIPDDYCKSHGYYNSLIPTGNVPNKPLSWDKALFYFCRLNKSYEYVWFIEDDVFVLKEDIFKKIDNYNNADLCVPFNDINTTGSHEGWTHWHMLDSKFSLPWCRSMVCACRLSKRLLEEVKGYVDNHKILLYHEFMFNTIAYQKGFSIECPQELSTIEYNTPWNENNLNLEKMYHPIKDINLHHKLRCTNNIYFDNLYNNYDYNNAILFNFNEEYFLLKYMKFPEDFDFEVYKKNIENSDIWTYENLAFHWFHYGQYENIIYK